MNYVYKNSGSFVDAVRHLNGLSVENTYVPASPQIKSFSECNITPDEPKIFQPPQRLPGRYKHAWAYLTQTRKISPTIFSDLVKKEVLYEDVNHNCVFINREYRYGEIVGTGYTRYKQTIAGSSSNGYWTNDNSTDRIAIVCESAIDAISLKNLMSQAAYYSDIFAFVSLGGVKESAFRHVTNDYKKIVIATDNDESGNNFPDKHPDFFRLSPPKILLANGKSTKDWNDILCADITLPRDFFHEINQYFFA